MVLSRPVNGARHGRGQPLPHNVAGSRIILSLAGFCAAAYGIVAWGGDWRDRIPLFLVLHGILILTMWPARRHFRLRTVLVAALLFRLIAACGEPALSDDIYRYVWDGRVQQAGIHPYLHPPDAPALRHLQDPDWRRINHRELPTIYPAGAQLLFRALATAGLGPFGFRIFLGLADFGVVLLLLALLRRTGRPLGRIVWYAWNPLAIVEVAASGHLEPVAVAGTLAALWVLRRGGETSRLRLRRAWAGALLAAAIQIKLLPLLLLPAWWRRLRLPGLAMCAATGVAISLPLLHGGPAVGGGLFAYARHWSANGFLFEGLLGVWQWLDWTDGLKRAVGWMQARPAFAGLPYEFLYRSVWPQELARATAAAAVFAGAVWVSWRRFDLERAALILLGASILFSPTIHPWYTLWVLPLAAAAASPGWLWLAATLPLAYLGDGDVPWALRCLEFLPAFAALLLPSVHGWAQRFLEPGEADPPSAR